MDKAALIGTFDGVHLGHQYLIRKFKELSHKEGLETLIITYKKHPRFHLDLNLEEHNTESDKKRIERLSTFGELLIIDFPMIKDMEAKTFFSYLKSEVPDLKVLYMGHDSSFGKDQVSDITKLNSLNLGFNFVQIEKFQDFHVSSSKLRELIRQGNFKEFFKLCGREYSIAGIVERGRQLGRQLGFPTANVLVPKENISLPNGVYAGYVFVDNNKYKAIANIGRRPTIDDDSRVTTEVHILNFSDDLYDKELEFFVSKKIRDVKKFSSKEELIMQIEKDILEC